MNKKIIIITIITVVITIFLGLLVTKNIIGKESKSKTVFDTKVVSRITMDINPSIEIGLNKDNLVVEVKSLNEDSQKIIKDNYSGKKLDETINKIVDNLKINNYLNDDDNTILVNVISEDSTLKDYIKNSFESVINEKKISSELIVLEVKETEELKELADKYNVTVAKIYYIEEKLSDNSTLTIEDLKDASLNEINLKTENIKEEIDKNETSINNNNNNQVNNNSTWSGCTPPGSATEKIADWCRYNSSRPQACEFTYPEMQPHDTVSSRALSHLGLTSWDTIGLYSSQMQDSRSSYCISQYAIVTTKQARTTIIFDSVTGTIIEEKSEPVPTPSISEMDAINILLSYYGFNYEDCQMCSANFSTNGEGSNNMVYRYDTGILMKSGEQHLANINPFTSEIMQIIY